MLSHERRTHTGVQTIECGDDAEVLIKAAAILQARVEHQGIEVWQGAHFVARIPRQPKEL
jgi:hypothetical protein